MVTGIEFRPRDGPTTSRSEPLQNTFGERAALLRLGGAPSALAYNLLPYFPDVFGVSSNAALTAGTFSLLAVTGTPSASDAYPALRPFEGDAPEFYSAFAPAAPSAASFGIPVHLGGLTLGAGLGAQQVATASTSAFDSGPACASVVSCGMISPNPLRDDRISAGTTFNVRAWGRPIALNLGASYDRLTRTDRNAFTPLTPSGLLQSGDGATLSALPDAGPISLNSNFVDVTRRSLDAHAAVPLTRQVTLNLQYNAQYYAGSYATLGAQSVDQRNDAYLGNITYTIPRTSSAIVFSAKQYRYWDAFVPTYNLTQNRADLNFTVKF